MSKGTDFEDWLESELILAYDDHKIRGFKREELKTRLKRGNRTQGKYDFEVTLNDGRILAIECKSVDNPNSMMTEFSKSKGIMIKKHQLIALRDNSKTGVSMFMLEYRRTNSKYIMYIEDYEQLIIKHGLIKSIKEEWLTRQITTFDDILKEVE